MATTIDNKTKQDTLKKGVNGLIDTRSRIRNIFLILVRDGEMTVEQYNRILVGVPKLTEENLQESLNEIA